MFISPVKSQITRTISTLASEAAGSKFIKRDLPIAKSVEHVAEDTQKAINKEFFNPRTPMESGKALDKLA